MPNTASASVLPWTWAMPQSSRVMVMRAACALHSAGPCKGIGSEPAVRANASGRRAAAVLRIRQCLLGLAPACKHLRRRALQQLIRVADGEVVAALIFVELFPGDRSSDRRAIASAHGEGHDRGRAALVAEPIEENPLFALDLADVGGEHLRLGLGDGAGEALGKALDGRPVARLIERRDDMHALAPRQYREGLEK